MYGRKERKKMPGNFKTWRNQKDVQSIEVVDIARVTDLKKNKVVSRGRGVSYSQPSRKKN